MSIRRKKVAIKMPGSCGELVQGNIDSHNFLITCPINLFSQIKVCISKGNDSIKCQPSTKWKSKRAIRKMLEMFNEKDLRISLKIKSEIPLSKGMASSTADIVGSCIGIAKLLSRKISEYEIAQIALSIEPSDGIMFNGIVMFDYLEGKIIKYLGSAPDMKILAVDTGGTINTLEFNKKDHRKIRLSQEKEIKRAIKLVEEGIKKKNCFLIGEGTTISAILNQQILFKSELDDIIKISKQQGAFGVCVAHSGTVIGILLPSDFTDMHLLKKIIINKFNKQSKFYQLKLINGGIYDNESNYHKIWRNRL